MHFHLHRTRDKEKAAKTLTHESLEPPKPQSIGGKIKSWIHSRREKKLPFQENFQPNKSNSVKSWIRSRRDKKTQFQESAKQKPGTHSSGLTLDEASSILTIDENTLLANNPSIKDMVSLLKLYLYDKPGSDPKHRERQLKNIIEVYGSVINKIKESRGKTLSNSDASFLTQVAEFDLIKFKILESNPAAIPFDAEDEWRRVLYDDNFMDNAWKLSDDDGSSFAKYMPNFIGNIGVVTGHADFKHMDESRYRTNSDGGKSTTLATSFSIMRTGMSSSFKEYRDMGPTAYLNMYKNMFSGDRYGDTLQTLPSSSEIKKQNSALQLFLSKSCSVLTSFLNEFGTETCKKVWLPDLPEDYTNKLDNIGALGGEVQNLNKLTGKNGEKINGRTLLEKKAILLGTIVSLIDFLYKVEISYIKFSTLPEDMRPSIESPAKNTLSEYNLAMIEFKKLFPKEFAKLSKKGTKGFKAPEDKSKIDLIKNICK